MPRTYIDAPAIGEGKATIPFDAVTHTLVVGRDYTILTGDGARTTPMPALLVFVVGRAAPYAFPYLTNDQHSLGIEIRANYLEWLDARSAAGGV
jgi:hypothetical protein